MSNEELESEGIKVLKDEVSNRLNSEINDWNDVMIFSSRLREDVVAEIGNKFIEVTDLFKWLIFELFSRNTEL